MTGGCYQPICPIGTYLCCVACGLSSCSSKRGMKFSTRGVRECVSCPPGHYCNGCDMPSRCPANSINPDSGMSRLTDCRVCMPGLTASEDQTRCCYNSQRCTRPSDEANYLTGTIWDDKSSVTGSVSLTWILVVLGVFIFVP
jgi:hypothetical protein